ncbi:MAG: hypothetical protein AAFN38_21975 [Cyanobacteria bacterium J06560_5]
MDTASKPIVQAHLAAEEFSVPALLSIKRFVRRTLRQVGLSGLSLMLILGLTAHSPREQGLSSYTTGQPNSTVIVQTVYEKADERTSQENDRKTFQKVDFEDHNLEDHNLEDHNLEDRNSSATSNQTLRPHRLLSAAMTHHHLTGSRLTIPTAQQHRGVDVATAE